MPDHDEYDAYDRSLLADTVPPNGTRRLRQHPLVWACVRGASRALKVVCWGLLVLAWSGCSLALLLGWWYGAPHVLQIGWTLLLIIGGLHLVLGLWPFHYGGWFSRLLYRS